MSFNFNYYSPTKVVFGRDAQLQAGALCKEFGASKVLVHFGGRSAKASGLIGQITHSLDEAGIAHVELGGVVPNPHLELVYEGIDLCRKEGVDFILAVGGGSTIDSAKAIAYGLAYDGDVWDFYSHKVVPTAAYGVGAVVTIAAAGSETSNSSVITYAKYGLKRSCNSDIARPRFAIMNPELTCTLPDYQTMSGCTDIMMHTLERYFAPGGNLALTDAIAEGLLRDVMKNALILHKDPANYEARAEILWAGSLSHNGLTACGIRGGDFICHALEHEMSGMFDVTHGAGLAACFGSWARYVMDRSMARFVQFAVNVMGVAPAATDSETAELGIQAIEAFFVSIGMPISMAQLGIHPTDEQISRMADLCAESCAGGKGTTRFIARDDMEKIYYMCRG